MKILWLGPVLSSTEVMKHVAVSPAANIWQINFLNSFETTDNIILLTYLPEPYFPKGKFISTRKENKNQPFDWLTFSNKFLNIPFFRELTLIFNIIYNCRKLKNIDYLITYNCYLPHKIIGIIFQKTKNLKWINIAADHDATKYSDATVFLSYYFYKNSFYKNKIFIDGGIETPIQILNKELHIPLKKQLLYCGAINKWTGIFEFVNMFLNLSNEITKDWELLIFGKGEIDSLKNIVNNNELVKIVGFVDDKILSEAMTNCFAFVNPRPEFIPKGENNFPSKLLLYLKYLKPILSTRSPGLSPNYNECLFFYSNSDDFSEQLNKISSYNYEDINILRNKLNKFCIENSWKSKNINFKKKVSLIFNLD
jgi:hypothetical protein